MRKLCELDWFKDIYRKIYDVLSVEDMLPDPCEINVLGVDEVETSSNVLGMAWRDSKTMWFRYQPPDTIVFAHELIHLIDARDKVHELEEIYSYNLAGLAVLLAGEGITPKINIVRLFSDATEDDILEAIRRVYRYSFKTLEEFFGFFGVIPLFDKFEVHENGEVRIVRDRDMDSRTVSILAVTEIAAGAEFDRLMLETVIELINIVADKIERF